MLDGNLFSTVQKKYNDPLNPPTPNCETGTFSGWEFNGSIVSNNMLVTSNMTLSGKCSSTSSDTNEDPAIDNSGVTNDN